MNVLSPLLWKSLSYLPPLNPQIIIGLIILCNNAQSLAMSTQKVTPLLVVHGGAGDIPDSRVEGKLAGVKRAASTGYAALMKTGNVLDGIEAAIMVMEDDENFNAGVGSALNLQGEVEMEALVTEGRKLDAGAISLVRCVQHPIQLARMVLEKSPHTMIGGNGADRFATKMGVERVPEYRLITKQAIVALERFLERGGDPRDTEVGKRKGDDESLSTGTVGCVAVDSSGHVASGTSTGGITGKWRGRVGDTPIPGSGGYSDDEIGSCSTTGHGEAIMRYNLAHRILTSIQAGVEPNTAAQKACEGMGARVGLSAGAIVVTKDGVPGVGFNSKRMAWAYILDNEVHYGIEPGQHLKEKLKVTNTQLVIM